LPSSSPHRIQLLPAHSLSTHPQLIFSRIMAGSRSGSFKIIRSFGRRWPRNSQYDPTQQIRHTAVTTAPTISISKPAAALLQRGLDHATTSCSDPIQFLSRRFP
jgi:hypothetical protein